MTTGTMLEPRPSQKADMFPTLHFDGNTSTTIELCWRIIKHTWFVDVNLPKPLHELLEPFLHCFVRDEIRFTATNVASASTVRTVYYMPPYPVFLFTTAL
jgi:hypothetical protein